MSAENSSSAQENPPPSGGDSSSSGQQRPDNMYQTPFDSGSSASSRVSAGSGSEVSSRVSAGDASDRQVASKESTAGRGPDGSGTRISAVTSGRGSSEIHSKDVDGFTSTGDPQADLDAWRKGFDSKMAADTARVTGKPPEGSDGSTPSGAVERRWADGQTSVTTVDEDGRATAHIDMGSRGRFTVSEQAEGNMKIDLPNGISTTVDRPDEAGVKTVPLGNGVTGIFDFKEDGTYDFSTTYQTWGSGGTRRDSGVAREAQTTIDDPDSWLNAPREGNDHIQRHTIGGLDVATVQEGNMLYTETTLPDGMRVRVSRDLQNPEREIVHYPNGTVVHLGPEKTVFDRDPREETNPDKRKEAEELADFLRDDNESPREKEEEELGALMKDVDKYMDKGRLRQKIFRELIKKRLERGQLICLRTSKATRVVEKGIIQEMIAKGDITKQDLSNIMIIGEGGKATTTYDAKGNPQHEVKEEDKLPLEVKRNVSELLRSGNYGPYVVDITRETGLSITKRSDADQDTGMVKKAATKHGLNKDLKKLLKDSGMDVTHEVRSGLWGGTATICCKDAGENLEEQLQLEFQAKKRREQQEALHPAYY